MTEAEYAALKVGDVVYTAWSPRDGAIVGAVVECCFRHHDCIIVQRPDLLGTSLYSGAHARRTMHTTPEKCRDAMVAEAKAEADSLRASADALYKKAEKAARRSYTVLHVPPRDGVMLRPEKRPKTKPKKKEST